ncbi:hypothetical protein G9A89_014359 [Geosiphon pyriformis]|nr:hypothetical protein G9A89_014359 [Geosiphon pyriformis]
MPTKLEKLTIIQKNHQLGNGMRERKKKKTLIEAIWRRTVQQLDSCPHDNNKIWRMAMAKIKKVSPEKIREIKNNLPETIELDWDPKPVINLLDPEQFYEHYQKLAHT